MTSTPPCAFGDGFEVLGRGVDDHIGAHAFGLRGFFLPSRGGDHRGAGGLGHLDGGDPDAGGGAVNHEGLAGRQGAVLEDVGVDGEHRLGQAGGLGEGQARRHGQGVTGVADRELRIAAPAQQGADAVALPPAAGRMDDFAGDLEAHGHRRAGRRRIEAHPLENVRPVDAGRFHLDQDFAGRGRGTRDVDRPQRLRRAATAVNGDGRHGVFTHAWRP